MRMRTDIVGAYLSPQNRNRDPEVNANLRDVAMDLEIERMSTNTISRSNFVDRNRNIDFSRSNLQHRCGNRIRNSDLEIELATSMLSSNSKSFS